MPHSLTAAHGAYQARRGVDALLKRKKSARDRLSDEELRTPDSSTSPESSAGPPSPREPHAREQPRIKTREAVSVREDSAGAGLPAPRARLQPPQALVQGEQEFMQERGRTAAIKHAEARLTEDKTAPQTGSNGESVSSAPARRGYAGSQGKFTPAQAVRGPIDSADPNVRPVRDGGQKAITAYLQYQLSSACLIIIGVELIMMITSYSLDSVVDVMLLAVSRQMLVEHTAPLENLLTVISVGLLFLIRKYLYISKIDKRAQSGKESESNLSSPHT